MDPRDVATRPRAGRLLSVSLGLALSIGFLGVAAADPPSVPGKPVVPHLDRPLDLRLGDLRRYFTPAELQSPVPDVIGDEIVVEGYSDRHPDPYLTPIPVGLVAPYWAATHPFSAWRIFLPDPNGGPTGPIGVMAQIQP